MKQEIFELIKRIEKGMKYIMQEESPNKREEAEELLIKLLDEFESKIKLIEDKTDKEILTKLFELIVRR